MALSIEIEMNRLAIELANLYKKVIQNKGLVDSGKLLKSIKCVSKKSSKGYNLVLVAEDYFKYVDEKYSITKDVRNSVEWKAILKRIGVVNSTFIRDSIIREFRKNK